MGNLQSPLRSALNWNDIPKVKQILDRAGDKSGDLINQDFSQDCILQSCTRAQGNSFYYAVSKNRLHAIPLMIAAGADIHAPGAWGETCMHCAARHCLVDVAKILLENGADVHATDDQGHYPIHLAAMFQGHYPVHSAGMTIFNTTTMIRWLLEEAGKREDVNLRDFSQRTPLHEAAVIGNLEVVQTLLEYGADVNAVSSAGNTPLHGAQRNKLVWNLLIEKGADLTAKNHKGQTPEDVVNG